MTFKMTLTIKEDIQSLALYDFKPLLYNFLPCPFYIQDDNQDDIQDDIQVQVLSRSAPGLVYIYIYLYKYRQSQS